MTVLCKYAPSSGSFYCQFYRTILCNGTRKNCAKYEPDKRPVCKRFCSRQNDPRGWCGIDDKGCDLPTMASCLEYKPKKDPYECIRCIKVGFSNRPFCQQDNMI